MIDDNFSYIYLTMHKAEQEHINKASPAREGIDLAIGSWKSQSLKLKLHSLCTTNE